MRTDPHASSPVNPNGLQKLGTLFPPPHPCTARGLRAEMQLMKALVQIHSTELVCVMWGGIAAGRGGMGMGRAPSQPSWKHVGIRSEPALFRCTHTRAFLSLCFSPSPSISCC